MTNDTNAIPKTSKKSALLVGAAMAGLMLGTTTLTACGGDGTAAAAKGHNGCNGPNGCGAAGTKGEKEHNGCNGPNGCGARDGGKGHGAKGKS
jgi:hypothetical protein